jgi:hypothetical protein
MTTHYNARPLGGDGIRFISHLGRSVERGGTLRAGAWGTALADLMHAVALGPREPAAALAAGVAALHYATRPYNPEALRHAWVLRAVALLQHAVRREQGKWVLHPDESLGPFAYYTRGPT